MKIDLGETKSFSLLECSKTVVTFEDLRAA